MNARRLAPLSALLALAALSGAQAQQKTLTWWTRASQVAQVQAVAAAYQKARGVKITVTPIPDPNFLSKFGTAVAGGQAPDIISVDIVYMPVYTQAGQLEDITNLVKAMPFAKQLSPGHMKLATYQGRNYGLPFGYDGSFLIYNKELFRRAGLDPNKPPKTYQDVLNYSKKITALGGGVRGFYMSGACAGCNAFTWLPLVWASGGNVLSKDGKTATLTDPAVKQALQLYRDLWVQGQMPAGARTDNGANFFNAFATGKIGMVGSGNFAIATLKKDYPKLDFGVAYLPGQKGNWSSFTGGDVVAISKGTKNAAAAQDLLRWMMSEEAQIEVVAKGGWLPVRADLAENKYAKADPRIVAAGRAAERGETPYSTKIFELFNDPNGPFLSMMQNAVFKGNIDAAIAKAQQDWTKILNTK